MQLLDAVLAKFVTCNEIKDRSSNLIGAWALQDLALFILFPSIAGDMGTN